MVAFERRPKLPRNEKFKAALRTIGLKKNMFCSRREQAGLQSADDCVSRMRSEGVFCLTVRITRPNPSFELLGCKCRDRHSPTPAGLRDETEGETRRSAALIGWPSYPLRSGNMTPSR